MKRRLTLIIIATLTVFSLSACFDDRFKDRCNKAGGHIYGSGITLCLTDDGRVLEIYP